MNKLIIGLILFLLLVNVSFALTENVTADNSTRVDNYDPNNNYGGSGNIRSSYDTGRIQRAYVYFNVTNRSQDWEMIHDAQLFMYVDNIINVPFVAVNGINENGAYNTPFDEYNVTWNFQPCGLDNFSLDSNCAPIQDKTIIDSDTTFFNWNVTNYMNDRMKVYRAGSINDTLFVLNNLTATNYEAQFVSTNGGNSSQFPYLYILFSNEAPTITGLISNNSSCIDTNELITWTWTQDDNSGIITQSNCTFTSPTALEYVVNSTDTNNVGSVNCSFTLNETGTWTNFISVADGLGNTTTSSTLSYNVEGWCQSGCSAFQSNMLNIFRLLYIIFIAFGFGAMIVMNPSFNNILTGSVGATVLIVLLEVVFFYLNVGCP